ncbi:hypothetical protein, partial [Marinimicrobium sp. UBA4209]
MSLTETNHSAEADKLVRLGNQLDEAIEQLADSREFAKITKLQRLLDIARRVLLLDGGCAFLEARAQRLEEAGVFEG